MSDEEIKDKILENFIKVLRDRDGGKFDVKNPMPREIQSCIL